MSLEAEAAQPQRPPHWQRHRQGQGHPVPRPGRISATGPRTPTGADGKASPAAASSSRISPAEYRVSGRGPRGTSCGSRRTSTSSWAARDAVFDELRPVFSGGYRPNRLHRLLAEQPARRRAATATASCRSSSRRTTTTRWSGRSPRRRGGRAVRSRLLRRPQRGEPGRFMHLMPDGQRQKIPNHTDYDGLDLARRR